MRLFSAVQLMACVATATLGFSSSALAWPLNTLEADGIIPPQPPFPRPEGLSSAVDFWSNLFLRHGNDHVVLHDRENMDAVWQVIELPRDPATGQVDERAAARLTHAAVEDLRRRLQRLEREPVALDGDDQALLAVAQSSSQPALLQGAALRIRAQRGVADQFRAGLLRCQAWLADIRQILRQEGVPEEIAALPFVESMFNPKARSAVGAAGVWQLMPATARGLGLHVSRKGDDRTNVLKATRAAARMLRKNYEMLGSWPLAITAYNHGPNGVRRAVNLVGSTDLTYLIDNYQRSTWGFASKNFYAEFLAAVAVVSANASAAPEAAAKADVAHAPSASLPPT
jgi:membrane-bound lytic murein transglycosylase D